MRVLQLCHKIPYPCTDGGSIAMHQITEGLLKQGFKVKVVALNFKGLEVEIESIPDPYRQKTNFEAHVIDTRVKALPALLNLFSSKSYNVSRFYCRDMEERLERILKSEAFDIIQLEGLYLTPYIPVIRKNSAAKLLFRSHNIEHLIWERMAEKATNSFKKWYLKLLATRLKKYEMQAIHLVDGLIAISPIDLEFFRQNGFNLPSVVIPVSIPQLTFPNKVLPIIPGTVFHLGSMDWRPNQEGIEWFLEKVWPLVIGEAPEMKFFLAGRRIPLKYYQYASNSVIVVGEVPSAAEFMADKQIMVVPLLSGGGMRVKIIEGMAAGKAIISTSIGAEGIGCADTKHIFLTDQPATMARKIIYCYQNPEMARQVGNNAFAFVNENFSADSLMARLVEFYNGFFSGSD